MGWSGLGIISTLKGTETQHLSKIIFVMNNVNCVLCVIGEQ